LPGTQAGLFDAPGRNLACDFDVYDYTMPKGQIQSGTRDVQGNRIFAKNRLEPALEGSLHPLWNVL
jgi:hypothetical protein